MKSTPLIIDILSDEEDDGVYGKLDGVSLCKSFVDDDECVILDGDPDQPIKAVSDTRNGSDELLVVAEKGQIACRDYPHPRYLCAQYPFSTNPHEKYCDQCHCYVCDVQAPCAYWGSGLNSGDHCHSTDKDELWRLQRKVILGLGLCILEDKSTGIVNCFDSKQGYGLITPDKGGCCLIFYRSSIKSEGYQSLAKGEAVEFQIVCGESGTNNIAINVRVLGKSSISTATRKADASGSASVASECFSQENTGHLVRDNYLGEGGVRGGHVARQGCHVRADVSEAYSDRRSGSRRVCSDCGERGHLAGGHVARQGCHVRADVSEAYSDRRSGSRRVCSDCGEHGHLAEGCRNRVGRHNEGSSGTGCHIFGELGYLSKDRDNRNWNHGVKRSNEHPNGSVCYTFVEHGHLARDSGNTSGRGGRSDEHRGGTVCYTCGEHGHLARNCENRSDLGGKSNERVGGTICYTCGEHGHLARDCENRSDWGGRSNEHGGGTVCYTCGEHGHLARNCENRSDWGVRSNERGGGTICYTCCEHGHVTRDCVNRSDWGGRSNERGGGTICYTCGEHGHLARDCENKSGGGGRSSERGAGSRCYHCGDFRHLSRNCSHGNRRGGGGGRVNERSSVRCYNSGDYGHLARDCNPKISGSRRYHCGEEGHIARMWRKKQ